MKQLLTGHFDTVQWWLFTVWPKYWLSVLIIMPQSTLKKKEAFSKQTCNRCKCQIYDDKEQWKSSTHVMGGGGGVVPFLIPTSFLWREKAKEKKEIIVMCAAEIFFYKLLYDGEHPDLWSSFACDIMWFWATCFELASYSRLFLKLLYTSHVTLMSILLEFATRLLEFATFNDLVLANTFGHHKASRRWTWHSPNRQHHNQIDYILVRKRFRSGVNIARTRSFPGADIGSDHDLLMITFRLRLYITTGCGARSTRFVGPREPLLVTVKRRKLARFGHITRHDSLFKTIIQGTLGGGQRRGRQRKHRMDIKERTLWPMQELLTRAFCRTDWKRISAEWFLMSPRRTIDQGT